MFRYLRCPDVLCGRHHCAIYVCCSLVFDTLVSVSVFSVIWSELLMTSDICCPLWSSVYKCQRVVYAITSPVMMTE